MNILHVFHKLCAGPQETPFIPEATDFTKNKFDFHIISYDSYESCETLKLYKYRFKNKYSIVYLKF